jgi:hypothetical protein
MRRGTLPLALFTVVALAASGCGSGDSPTQPSPPPADFSAQFDSLWTTFDREYSYFEYKRIDWEALRTTYRPRAVAAPDHAGFIFVIREMLAHLHDLHVVLRDSAGGVHATYNPQFFAPALVLDVRMNPGGNDSLAFEIAGRFAPAPVVTGYVRFRSGPSHSDFGPPMQRTLNPRGAWQYTGSVFLLIGRGCASSNESFIEAMRQLPHVTLVSDRTAGSTGNPWTFPLAGGWSYSVSRWIEYTADNQVIEDVGISPRLLVPTGPSDFAQGRDRVLDWALNATRSPVSTVASRLPDSTHR